MTDLVGVWLKSTDITWVLGERLARSPHYPCLTPWKVQHACKSAWLTHPRYGRALRSPPG